MFGTIIGTVITEAQQQMQNNLNQTMNQSAYQQYNAQWQINLNRQLLLVEEMKLLEEDEGLRQLKDAAVKAEGEYQMWLALKRKAI